MKIALDALSEIIALMFLRFQLLFLAVLFCSPPIERRTHALPAPGRAALHSDRMPEEAEIHLIQGKSVTFSLVMFWGQTFQGNLL